MTPYNSDPEYAIEHHRAELVELHPDELTGLGGMATEGFRTAPFAVPEHTAVREDEVYRVSRNPDTYEVTVESDVTLEQIRDETHPDDWDAITKWAAPLQGKTVVMFNPTMEGGGVAMMRPPLVHLMNKLGVNAHWYVMEHTRTPEQGNPFLFTKQMHNISQRMTTDRITEEGKQMHKRWADEENGPVLEAQPTIQNADFILIDDPQPAPLIARLKQANPNAKLIWRNHIDTDGALMSDPSTPQGEVADYLLDECGVIEADAVITHPVEQFVHPRLSEKTFFAPATFDPFDNLNRHLDEDEIVAGIEFINSEIEEKNRELAEAGRTADMQPLLSLDPSRQRISLIARFDPSKGMDKAMEIGVKTRQKMREAGVAEDELPEIVIVGNGSIDDTDGDWMFERMLHERREKYPDEAHGITLMRLKHNYDAMNALMSRSEIVMQTSDREGLETRAGDAIRHGKPVVISNRGGIKTQVVEGESGIVLDFDRPDHDLDRGATFMSELLMDPVAYAVMAAKTKELGRIFNSREFITAANAGRFLRIFNHLLEKPGQKSDRTWKMSELVAPN